MSLSKLASKVWTLLSPLGFKKEKSLGWIARQLEDTSEFSNLRVDFIEIKHKIAVEVNGKQHYEQSFGQDKIAFLQSKYRDTVKVNELDRLGVDLYVIRYDSTEKFIDSVVDEIERKVKCRVVTAEKRNKQFQKSFPTGRLPKRETKKNSLNSIRKFPKRKKTKKNEIEREIFSIME